MGRGGGRRRYKASDSDEPRAKKLRTERTEWNMAKADNALLRKYYEHQKLFATPEEFDQFYGTLQTDLPAWFRLTGFRGTAYVLKEQLEKTIFKQLEHLEVDGAPVPIPSPIPWYPGGLAYRVDMSRNVIRKNLVAKQFHTFLVSESEQGNISRQEAVSMIPPLVLDVQPHHRVLDMCAAPGSKTAQLIEMLHAGGDMEPAGLVIANDADNKRCYLLTHMTKRLQSPCFMVTNLDATGFPRLTIDSPTKPGEKTELHFDRVLCDAPCTGDGTLRKNPMLWKTWSPMAAYGLHRLQTRILRRSLELTAVGGRIVYSTCSCNPVENEAVVAELLRTFKDEVEVLDMSESLPELKRAPGLTTWTLMDKRGEFYSAFKDLPADVTKIRESMFPPTAEEAAAMHLDRCWRIYPHLQDTGGFFVAVLYKKAPLSRNEARKLLVEGKGATAAGANPNMAGEGAVEDVHMDAEPQEEEQKEEDEAVVSLPAKQQGGNKTGGISGYTEASFEFLVPGNELLRAMSEVYGLKESFPFCNVLVRGEGERNRHLYLVNDVVKSIMTHNDPSKYRLVNTGLRIFTRTMTHDDAGYRLTQESLDVVMDYVTKRKVEVKQADILKIVKQNSTSIAVLSPAVAKTFAELGNGVCLLQAGPESPEDAQCRTNIIVWVGDHVVRTLVSQGDRSHIRLALGDMSILEVTRTTKVAKEQVNGKEAQPALKPADAVSADTCASSPTTCKIEKGADNMDQSD